jgi:hypothetical protein
MFIYRELNTVTNRSYVGSSNSYTFNGGSNGELVGSLVFNNSATDYIVAIENTNILASKVYISKNNSTYLVVNETTGTITVYRKTNSGIWNEIGLNLNTGISDNQGISVHISYNGDYIALGFKNANNGEGVVQVWKRNNNSWTKDLHMSSPNPVANLTAFGHRACISDSGTRLVVSELGSNTVYIFDKTTLWSNTPTEAIIGSEQFGYDIDINKTATSLLINELDTKTSYLYKLDSSWTLDNTWNEGIKVKLHPTEDKVLLSDYLLKNVKLHTKNTTWSLTKTFTSSNDNFGYDIDIIDNSNVYILDLTASLINVYDSTDSYNLLASFDGGLSIDENIYTFSASNSSIVFSNYDNLIRLITNDGSSLPERIINVRQKFSNVPLTTLLDGNDVQILTFTSNVPLSIDKIGNSLISTGLNGLWLGTLFFNSILTTNEVESLESFIIKYLKLERYSLYI